MAKRDRKPPTDAASSLRIKPLAIDTLRENVVVLSRHCRALRPERLKGFRKVQVRANGYRLDASILISDDPAWVADDEIGVTMPALRRLGAVAGAMAHVCVAAPAAGLDAIQAKIRGETLSASDIATVVGDLAGNRLSDIEIAAFLIACASFMTAEEVLALTRAMASVGAKLSWDRPLIVDKHSIGGIPGNRTTMIVVPIVAAHGLVMPKTSSRAITSPAGTADAMEVLARVDLTVEEMRRVTDQCNACIAWGGHVKLSPVDDILISVERPLALDTPEQMVASILSKKIAAGVTHIVLDLPIGPTAKIRSSAYAQRVRKLFEFVAARCGMTIDVIVSDGAQPIGRGVGPFLEARDVMQVLRNDPAAPADLRAKALHLASHVLEFDPALPGGRGEARAKELLESGAALKAMEAIIEAQGPAPRPCRVGALAHEVFAAQSGFVSAIDCFRIARIARLAGAPTDPGAGLDLLKRVGDRVGKGEPLYRLHGEDPADFAAAVEAASIQSGFAVSGA
jgi:thymidine phosphorylase